jgi:hypothetical protein
LIHGAAHDCGDHVGEHVGDHVGARDDDAYHVYSRRNSGCQRREFNLIH